MIHHSKANKTVEESVRSSSNMRSAPFMNPSIGIMALMDLVVSVELSQLRLTVADVPGIS
jgi:hypothetical protein